MARLSSSEDLDFLRTWPEFRGEREAKFLREQRRICRLYLQEIAADFRRLHKAARALVAHAPEEHADLVGLLFHQQVVFWRALVVIEIRLMLGAAGVPQMNLGTLLGSVDDLRSALARSAATAQTA